MNVNWIVLKREKLIKLMKLSLLSLDEPVCQFLEAAMILFISLFNGDSVNPFMKSYDLSLKAYFSSRTAVQSLLIKNKSI